MKKWVLVISLALNVAFAAMWIAGAFKYEGCSKNQGKDEFAKGAFESLSDIDKEFAERLVRTYDEFVRSRVGDSLPLAEAYTQFFRDAVETLNLAGMGGNIENVRKVAGLDSLYGYALAYDIITQEIFTTFIQPRYYPGRGPETAPHWSFSSPNYYPLRPFLRKVAEESGSEFWAQTFEHVEAMGDFPPTVIAGLFFYPEEVDFDDLAQRFVVALAFLQPNFGDNFVLKADLPRYEMVKNNLRKRNDDKRTN